MPPDIAPSPAAPQSSATSHVAAEPNDQTTHNPFAWRGGLPVAILIALACAAFLISQRPQPCDDAFITFRHVRNLVERGRPAWNLYGTPVLGSTTPAFMILLSIPAFIFGPAHLPWIALCVNAAFHAAIVLLVFLILRELGCRVFPSLIGAALIGINSVNIMIFSEGFENAMFTAAVLAALYFAARKAWRSSVILASLAPLIRPEGILVWIIVWTALFTKFLREMGKTPLPLRERAGVRVRAPGLRTHTNSLIPLRNEWNDGVRAPSWSLVAMTLIAPLLWLAFSTYYYGSPIPQSLQAMRRFPEIYHPYESQPISILTRMPKFLKHVSDLWGDPAGPLLLHGMWKGDDLNGISTARKVLMYLGMTFGTWYGVRRRRGWPLLVAFPVLFLLCFALLRYTKPWYYPSFVTVSLLVIYVSTFIMIEEVRTALARWACRVSLPMSLRAGAYAICMLAVSGLFISPQHYDLNHGEYDYADKGPLFARHPFGKLWELWEDQRNYQYHKAAEFLNGRATPDATALITEVGVFGFYYRGEVLDTVGLCSPEALPFYPPPREDIYKPDGELYSKAETFAPTAMIIQLRPEFVVNSRTYLAHLLRHGSPFSKEYVQMAEFGRVWGEPLLIYARRDVAAPSRH